MKHSLILHVTAYEWFVVVVEHAMHVYWELGMGHAYLFDCE